MAYVYDEYGRVRGNGEPAFFESRDPIPDHYPNEYYSSDSRDNHLRRPDDRQRASPLKQNRAQKMSTTSDSDGSEHVSAETIAAITERIKQEGKSDLQPLSEPRLANTCARCSSRAFKADRQHGRATKSRAYAETSINSFSFHFLSSFGFSFNSQSLYSTISYTTQQVCVSTTTAYGFSKVASCQSY
jgi:hypothetical protein